MVLDDAFWAIDAKFTMEENIKELEQISRRLKVRMMKKKHKIKMM